MKADDNLYNEYCINIFDAILEIKEKEGIQASVKCMMDDLLSGDINLRRYKHYGFSDTKDPVMKQCRIQSYMETNYIIKNKNNNDYICPLAVTGDAYDEEYDDFYTDEEYDDFNEDMLSIEVLYSIVYKECKNNELLYHAKIHNFMYKGIKFIEEIELKAFKIEDEYDGYKNAVMVILDIGYKVAIMMGFNASICFKHDYTSFMYSLNNNTYDFLNLMFSMMFDLENIAYNIRKMGND